MHTNTRASQLRAGFTLVEIAVVLVIVGMVIGGVIVGQSLIRTSEVNSVSSDLQKYKGLFTQFRLKYNYLPGDLPKAYSYWPTAGCTDSIATGSNINGCNGNGDGTILAFFGNLTNPIENFRAWQHLSLAGLLPGKYTGTSASGCWSHSAAGVNAPATRITGVLVATDQVYDWSALTGNAGRFAGNYPNGFIVGRLDTNTPNCGSTWGSPSQPFLTPTEIQSIDAKVDDGAPGTGKYRSWSGNSNCTTSTLSENYLTANYNLTYQGEACALRVDLE